MRTRTIYLNHLKYTTPVQGTLDGGCKLAKPDITQSPQGPPRNNEKSSQCVLGQHDMSLATCLVLFFPPIKYQDISVRVANQPQQKAREQVSIRLGKFTWIQSWLLHPVKMVCHCAGSFGGKSLLSKETTRTLLTLSH